MRDGGYSALIAIVLAWLWLRWIGDVPIVLYAVAAAVGGAVGLWIMFATWLMRKMGARA